MNFLLAFIGKYRIYVYTAILVSVFTAGYKTSSHFSDETIEDLKADHDKFLAKIEEENNKLLTERQDQINYLQEEFARADKKYFEVLKNAQNEIARRDADILGLRRVQHVKIKKPVCPSESNGANSNTSGLDGTTLAELDPRTAISAYRVTDRGDAIITSCNLLKDKIELCIKRGECNLKIIE